MLLTLWDRNSAKQLQHSRTESSRKQSEKTVRQRSGERKRRRREMTGASAPVFPGPQGRPLFRRCPMHAQLPPDRRHKKSPFRGYRCQALRFFFLALRFSMHQTRLLYKPARPYMSAKTETAANSFTPVWPSGIVIISSMSHPY